MRLSLRMRLVNATPIPNPNQVLIRFDNIIGSGAGQVPAGATIHAAILELTSINADAQGAGGQFHRPPANLERNQHLEYLGEWHLRRWG